MILGLQNTYYISVTAFMFLRFLINLGANPDLLGSRMTTYSYSCVSNPKSKFKLYSLSSTLPQMYSTLVTLLSFAFPMAMSMAVCSISIPITLSAYFEHYIPIVPTPQHRSNKHIFLVLVFLNLIKLSFK